MDDPTTFEDLVRLMDRLREPGGCPWDREQTYATLRGYLLEECYEAVDALDRGDRAGLGEELGDLLFQVVFLSRLAKEEGHFDASDVVRGIGAKIVRRHPHVFGNAQASTSEEVLREWEEVKRQEKLGGAVLGGGEESVLSGLPQALPALLKAHRLGTKASRVGFDWTRAEDVLAKVDEEMRELGRAIARDEREGTREEIGDLLFSVVMLSRHLGVDPEEALEHANIKFQRRFGRLERELRRRGVRWEDADPVFLDRLWMEMKSRGDSELS